MSIYVGNLSYQVTKENLEADFGEYGTVQPIHLPTDRESGKLRGLAFIEKGNNAEAEKAIATLNGAIWMARAQENNGSFTYRENRF